MKTLHTTGPWFIERRTNDGGTTHHSITASDGHGWSVDRYMSVSGCIDEHDARLIAAAPELLEALRGMLALDEEHHQRGHCDDDVCAEVRKAREAIAKATGENT